MSEVKRYTLWTVSESGCELEPYSEESPDGLYVHHADYAHLEQECERLHGELALAMKVPSVAAMHTFLDTEMAKQNVQLGAERDAMRQQRDKLAKVLEDVEREHDLIRRMKNCEIRRSRGSFGIAVMSDPPALEWQALDKELQQFVDARRAALATHRKQAPSY